MEPTRLHDIPEYQLAKYPKAIAIASKVNGAWKGHSTQELITTAEKVALGLMRLGVKPGDKVALASGNRSEWCLVDQAILRIGAIGVPIYPTSSAEDFAYVLNHSGSKVFFGSNAEIMGKAVTAVASCPELPTCSASTACLVYAIGARWRTWPTRPTAPHYSSTRPR
jgi:long-chain acyl-CoA synthetase